MRLRRLRETGGELSAELTVEVDPSTEGGGPVHLAQARFNLSSLHVRGSWAKDLTVRADGLVELVTHEAHGADWRAALDQLCLAALRLHRGRLQFTVVGQRTRRPTRPRALGPLFPIGQASIVFAPGGTGKTTFAALVAVQIQTGAEVFPGWPSMTAPVLVLDWETTADDWNDLVAEVAEGAGIDPPSIDYVRVRGSISDHIEEIAEHVAEREIRFVIVDSVEAASGARDGEGWNDRVNRLFDAVDLLGITVLLVDHVAGDDLDGARTTSKPYGGVFKLNRARQLIEIRREKEPADGLAELVMREVKVNATAPLPARGFQLCYEPGSIRLRWAEVEAAELVKRLSKSEQMARLLRGGAMSTKDLAERLEVSEASVRTYVSRSQGRFVRLADGRVGLSHAD